MKKIIFLFSLAFTITVAKAGNELSKDSLQKNNSTAIEIPDNGISNDCEYKGKKLYGKIKYVTSFPDIKIQIVDAFPDIKVKVVDAFPDQCGKWQIVESFPDIKVQIVESFPDIKVKFVDSFPGLK